MAISPIIILLWKGANFLRLVLPIGLTGRTDIGRLEHSGVILKDDYLGVLLALRGHKGTIRVRAHALFMTILIDQWLLGSGQGSIVDQVNMDRIVLDISIKLIGHDTLIDYHLVITTIKAVIIKLLILIIDHMAKEITALWAKPAHRYLYLHQRQYIRGSNFPL